MLQGFFPQEIVYAKLSSSEFAASRRASRGPDNRTQALVREDLFDHGIRFDLKPCFPLFYSFCLTVRNPPNLLSSNKAGF